MDNDTKATERPWTTDPETEHEGVLGPDGVLVADCSIFVNPSFGHRSQASNRANAELIVTAVNSYDPALQDKLTKAVKALDEVQDYIQRGGDLEELGKIVSAALRQIKESEHG